MLMTLLIAVGLSILWFMWPLTADKLAVLVLVAPFALVVLALLSEHVHAELQRKIIADRELQAADIQMRAEVQRRGNEARHPRLLRQSRGPRHMPLPLAQAAAA
jgi:hypothetical protein